MPAVSEVALRAGRADGEDGTPGRPGVVSLLSAAFAATPALQVLALVGPRLLNAAAERPWSWVAYGLLGPYVAGLLWRGHPRARFAAYLFLTHEVVRGAAGTRGAAVLAALAGIALLQLPAARRYLPPIRPGRLAGGGGARE
jgi:hypothetical protein